LGEDALVMTLKRNKQRRERSEDRDARLARQQQRQEDEQNVWDSEETYEPELTQNDFDRTMLQH